MARPSMLSTDLGAGAGPEGEGAGAPFASALLATSGAMSDALFDGAG